MIVLAVVGALAVGVALQLQAPAILLAPALPAAVLAGAAHLRSRRFLPLAALALAVTPFPVFVPRLVPLGGRAVFITDLVLPLAAAVALRRPSRARGADRAVATYALVMALLAVWGLARGAGLDALVQDGRGPLYLVCGYLVATRLLEVGDRRAVAVAVGAVLWWSTVMIVLSLLTGQELLSGRVGEAQAFVGDGKQDLDAIRFLIASKELALIALAAGLAWLLLGHRMTWRLGLGLLFPAALVLFMAFSRQSVVGLVAALLVVLVAAPSHLLTVHRAARLGAGLAIVVGALAVSGVGQRIVDPDSGVLGRQVEGFTERVVGGLTGDELVEDPGTRFRALENELAAGYALDRPLAGGGLGASYRGRQALEAFHDVEYGSRYVHNVYLWYAVKGGLVGLGAIALLLGRPLLRSVLPAVRVPVRHRDELLALGAALTAIVVVGVVEPVIHLAATAPVVGALVGTLGVLGADRSARALAPAEAV